MKKYYGIAASLTLCMIGGVAGAKNLDVAADNTIAIGAAQLQSVVIAQPIEGQYSSNVAVSVVASGSRNITGNGRNITGNGRNITGNGRNITGNGRNITGNGRNITGNGRNITGNGRNITGNGRNITGNGR
jgi:hypothetical protein